MYYDEIDPKLCKVCKIEHLQCVCKSICQTCKFFKKSSCDNKDSGNYRITMQPHDYCSKQEEQWSKLPRSVAPKYYKA